MKIKRNDLFILEIIEKLTVITARNITVLAGYHDVSVVRKRLKTLESEGYISSHWFDRERLFFLTNKGLSELAIRRKPYEIKGYSTEHSADVSAAATWLYISTKSSIYDMAFDRDIKSAQEENKYRLVHSPDIIFSHKCVEVELNFKKIDVLNDNFSQNARNFSEQIWIIKEHHKRLYDRLLALAEKHNSKIYITTIESVNESIRNFDLKSNNPRLVPLRNIEPSPITQKEKRVVLDD